jgi:hypothetical protein
MCAHVVTGKSTSDEYTVAKHSLDGVDPTLSAVGRALVHDGLLKL